MGWITKNGHHILIGDETENIKESGTLKEAIENHYRKTSNRREVLVEYLREATPGKGNIDFDVGYDKTKKESILEMETADIVHKTFGGDITLLNSSNFEHKSPDTVWEGRNWEIKHPTSINAISKRTEKGLQQIGGDGGGIILNLANLDISLSMIKKTVDNRINYSWRTDAPVDVMIIKNKKVITIWRYKK